LAAAATTVASGVRVGIRRGSGGGIGLYFEKTKSGTIIGDFKCQLKAPGTEFSFEIKSPPESLPAAGSDLIFPVSEELDASRGLVLDASFLIDLKSYEDMVAIHRKRVYIRR
jgi:hypothetical protein